jgi:hypothetical protein
MAHLGEPLAIHETRPWRERPKVTDISQGDFCDGPKGYMYGWTPVYSPIDTRRRDPTGSQMSIRQKSTCPGIFRALINQSTIVLSIDRMAGSHFLAFS